MHGWCQQKSKVSCSACAQRRASAGMRERGRVHRAPYGLYEPLGLVAEDVPVKVNLTEVGRRASAARLAREPHMSYMMFGGRGYKWRWRAEVVVEGRGGNRG